MIDATKRQLSFVSGLSLFPSSICKNHTENQKVTDVLNSSSLRNELENLDSDQKDFCILALPFPTCFVVCKE